MFFDRVLASFGDDSIVFVVPALYKNQRFSGAVGRYVRTFGLAASWALAVRVVGARVRRRSLAGVCKRRGVPCHSVRDVNDPAFVARLRELGPELIVSVSCPQIFEKSLRETPSRGCLGVHGAILPNYRGVMPSFWTLANAERQAGVSVFRLDEGIDEGMVYGQRVYDVDPDETLDQLVRRSKQIAAELVIDVLGEIERGTASAVPVDLASGSYYSWPTRTDVRRLVAGGRRLW